MSDPRRSILLALALALLPGCFLPSESCINPSVSVVLKAGYYDGPIKGPAVGLYLLLGHW